MGFDWSFADEMERARAKLNAGVLGSGYACSNASANPSTSSSSSMADLREMMATLEAKRAEDDRKVFEFPGTMAEFKAAFAKESEIPEWPDFSPEYPGFRTVFGLEVVDCGSTVLIGTPKALKAYRDLKWGEYVAKYGGLFMRPMKLADF